MHYILFIRVLGLHAKALEMHDPTLREKPLVIHRDKVVLDVNHVGLQRRISRGMLLSEARCIAGEGTFLGYDPEPFREGREQWLNELMEFSSVIEPKEDNSAWIDLTGHSDPAEIAMRISGLLERKLELPIEMGSGPAKWIAETLCGLAPRELREIALGDGWHRPATVLADLHPKRLLPVDVSDQERLVFLGYSTIGTIASLPLDLLASVFESRALVIHHASHGKLVDLPEPLFPKDCLSATEWFDGGLSDLLQLEAILRDLSQRLGQELASSDRSGSKVRLDVAGELRNYSFVRSFAKEIDGPVSLFSALKLLMSHPPSEDLFSIQVRILGVKKAKGVQARLDGQFGVEERTPRTDAALRQLRGAFGNACVLTGSELFEPRRKKLLRLWRDIGGWV
jgi:nucleotidyltransferase/DNA polymerase involved in DNA repair